jgi:DNA-binding NtrC family response regulator
MDVRYFNGLLNMDRSTLGQYWFLYGLLDPPSSGLELYRLRPTDLVITDIVMPERNGLDILLELTCEFLDAKVISISGARGGKNDLDIAKLVVARWIFQEPFCMPQLLDAGRYEAEY